ncbi:MAG: D-alanyl-D-alanine carboxypeptidase family protein, partial [Candidatus Saccharimonadales bacterium]
LDTDLVGNKDYINKAKECFGDTISKDSDGIWNITSGRGDSAKYKDLSTLNCGDKSDVNWLTIRMFILDYSTYEPMACLAGQDDACAELGFNGGASTSTQPAAVAAGGELYQDSSSMSCAAGTTDVGVHTGYHGGQPVNIKLCALPNMPSQSSESQPGSSYYVAGANGDALVNARVSGQYFALVQAAAKDGVVMRAQSTYRTMEHQQSICNQNTDCTSGSYTTVAKPGNSNHQMGLAIDFGKENNASAITKGDQWYNWLTANAANFGVKNYPVESWHWSATGN